MKYDKAFRLVLCLLAAQAIVQHADHADANPDPDKPLLSDFIGLNGHSFLIDTSVYSPVASQIRDYHTVGWDLLGDNNTSTWYDYNQWSYAPAWAENGVDWLNIYTRYANDGFDTNTSIKFDGLEYEVWNDFANDTYNYGHIMSDFYGPNATGDGQGLIDSLQIGNEPGNYNDLEYRKLFESIAQGARAADPDLKLVTAAIQAGPSDRYSKSLDVFKGTVSGQLGGSGPTLTETADLTDLVDVYAIHAYAQVQGYPTWERTYPEDSTFPGYLSRIQSVIDWRDANDPTAEVWITEFGYDASSKTPNPSDPIFGRWVDVTDLQQAQYLTRSWLAFSGMDLDKAYMYFFDDKDVPSVHASSGLTRNGVPKPSFWATKHLQETLGDYRFDEKIVENPDDLYVYSFVNGEDSADLVWAVWLPTGEDGETELTFEQILLENLPGTVLSAERMALTGNGATHVSYSQIDDTSISLMVGESPIFLRFLAAIAGDFDNDGTIGQSDLDLVLQFWGYAVEDGQSPDPLWINPEGVVGPTIGQDELSVVLRGWGETSALAAELASIAAATGLTEDELRALIPEPSSLALLLFSGLILTRRR